MNCSLYFLSLGPPSSSKESKLIVGSFEVFTDCHHGNLTTEFFCFVLTNLELIEHV